MEHVLHAIAGEKKNASGCPVNEKMLSGDARVEAINERWRQTHPDSPATMRLVSCEEKSKLLWSCPIDTPSRLLAGAINSSPKMLGNTWALHASNLWTSSGTLAGVRNNSAKPGESESLKMAGALSCALEEQGNIDRGVGESVSRCVAESKDVTRRSQARRELANALLGGAQAAENIEQGLTLATMAEWANAGIERIEERLWTQRAASNTGSEEGSPLEALVVDGMRKLLRESAYASTSRESEREALASIGQCHGAMIQWAREECASTLGHRLKAANRIAAHAREAFGGSYDSVGLARLKAVARSVGMTRAILASPPWMAHAMLCASDGVSICEDPRCWANALGKQALLMRGIKTEPDRISEQTSHWRWARGRPPLATLAARALTGEGPPSSDSDWAIAQHCESESAVSAKRRQWITTHEHLRKILATKRPKACSTTQLDETVEHYTLRRKTQALLDAGADIAQAQETARAWMEQNQRVLETSGAWPTARKPWRLEASYTSGELEWRAEATTIGRIVAAGQSCEERTMVEVARMGLNAGITVRGRVGGGGITKDKNSELRARQLSQTLRAWEAKRR